uniref:Protein-tyrosine-phosphatase n=1 Tax=Leptobrachium leishanense TaxID=445787 RepID=A0A8C5R1K3_9ANUR
MQCLLLLIVYTQLRQWRGYLCQNSNELLYNSNCSVLNHKIIFKNLTLDPLPVKQLRSGNVTSDSVPLIWDHPDEYKSDYSYRVQTANSSSVTLKNQTTATNQSVVTNLTPGETYTFTVFTRAADTVTESEPVSYTTCMEPLPVKQLRSSNVTSDSVSLIWDHPDEYKSDYSYRVQTANSSSVTLKNQTTATNQSVVTNLTAGETYTFIVFTRAADTVTESEPVSHTTCTEPLPVKQLRSSNVTSDSVSLIWDHPDEYKSDYSYRVQTANSSSVTLKNQTTATNQSVVTDLTPGETYTFTVFTRAADNVTESEPDSYMTCTEPLPVMQLRSSNVTPNSVSLIWDGPNEYNSDYTYRVQTANSSTEVNNETTSTNQSVITNLTAGETYTFTVFTRAADNITESEPVSYLTCTEPLPVKQLSSSNVTSDSVSLIWDYPDEYKSDYSYRVQTANSSSVTLKNQTTATNQSVVTNLTPGETYTFTVFTRAADTVTESEAESYTICTGDCTLNLQNHNVRSDSVSLIWDHPDEYKSDYTYRVQTANSSSVTLKNQTTATNQSVVTNLTAGETYTFTVFTQAADNVTESEPVSYTTLPLPVKQLRSSNVTSDSVSLIWDHPDEYKSDYSYRVQTANSSSVTLKNQTTATNQSVVTNLTPGEIYTFTLFTNTADTVTESVSVLYMTCTEPLPVKQLASSLFTLDSFSLSWDHPDEYKSDYTFRVQTANSSSEIINQTTATKQLVFTNLTPGESYTSTVFTIAADNITESEPASLTNCTASVPAPSFHCDSIFGESALSFTWMCPTGSYTGSSFTVTNATTSSSSLVPFHCTSRNESAVLSGLNFYHQYFINVTRLLCGKNSLEQIGSCWTSISLGDQAPTAAMLNLTYNDYKSKKTNIYVTYIKESGERKSRSGNSIKVTVGDGSKTRGYENGPLEPLNSYSKAEDFWQTIMTNNISTIVTLAKNQESSQVETENYWPTSDTETHNDITVMSVKEEVLPEWTVRDLRITNCQEVRQYQFTAWPETHTARTRKVFMKFVLLVQERKKQNNTEAPTLIHCSAGTGRSDVFIALDHIINQAEEENSVDVYKIVRDMHMLQPPMIQTEEQYVFLQQCALDIAKYMKKNAKSKKKEETDHETITDQAANNV